MKACSVTGLVGAGVTLVLLGCGGSAGGGAEPASPAPGRAEEATGTAAPTKPTEEPPSRATGADPAQGDTRTMEVIAAAVKAHRKEARDCYEQALKQIPGLRGDVVIRFTLKPSGKVKQAELNRERSTITEASVSTCVIGVISAIEFPRSSKGMETTVNYPFNFNP